MKKSLIALAFLACTSFAMSVFDRVGSFLSEAYGYAKSLARHAIDVLAPATVEKYLPKIPLAQAKAFMQRIVKRERPVIMGSWRMCPGV